MKFECDKTVFSAAIDGVGRAITNRSANPILEGILIKAENDTLTLTGYDMEMGITTTIDCTVMEPGETVLEAKLLGQMVSRMVPGMIKVVLNANSTVTISGGGAAFEVPAMLPDEYPSLPVTGAEHTLTMKCGVLRDMIEKTIYAVSIDEKKPAHTGELFVVEPNLLTIAALDGYRLAIVKRRVEGKKNVRIIIPAKPLQELLKLMGGEDEDVAIDAGSRFVVFTTKSFTLISRLLEGEFLNYENVLPKSEKTIVEVNCREFIDVIERASLVITERLKNPLRIQVEDDSITVRCQTSLGKVVDKLDLISMKGEPIEIGFNNRYLLDALRSGRTDTVRMTFNSPISPVLVLPPDSDPDDFTYLVLPVRFKNEA